MRPLSSLRLEGCPGTLDSALGPLGSSGTAPLPLVWMCFLTEIQGRAYSKMDEVRCRVNQLSGLLRKCHMLGTGDTFKAQI